MLLQSIDDQCIHSLKQRYYANHQAIAMLRAAILSSPLRTPVYQLATTKRATAFEDMFLRVLFPLIDTTLHLRTTLASTQQPEHRLTYVYKPRSTEGAHAANEAQLRSLLLVSDVLAQVISTQISVVFSMRFLYDTHDTDTSLCFPLLLSRRT